MWNEVSVLSAGSQQYSHIQHLLEFERRQGRDLRVPEWLQIVAMPLVRSQWAAELRLHPDTEFREYMGYGRGPYRL